MTKIIVDADACPRPCLDLLKQVHRNYGIRLLTIASFNHVIDNPDHIIVGNERDAADLVVINHTQAGDLVVTQDWGLAALVLGKGAHALSPSGRIYTNDRIGFMLEERSLKAKYRRGGGRTKGPAARKSDDNVRFEQQLNHILKLMGVVE